MGAPGIEAGTLATTVVHFVPQWPTETERFQVFPITTVYSVLPSPPTYLPPKSHPYKCPGGQL
jgi:hypothetical protein